MEVRITSMETVRPFAPQVNALKLFKLSFLDQLFAPYYVPVIFFFTPSNGAAQLDSAQISAQLKNSLSKALNVFYPLSGRVIDNFCIDYYKEGVPCVEARVNGSASDYLQPEEESERLNDLLPCECFVYHSNPKSLPLLAVQLNVFDCGGIALALCGSHKIMDAATAFSFVRSWAAFSLGFNGEIPQPDSLCASSRLLPPMDRVPLEVLSMLKSRYFKEGRYKTKTFVFDANAIATLIFKAKSKSLDRPSQTEVLTAFIWKHAMLASRSASGIVKPSICAQVVNLRPRVKPKLPVYSIGNLALPCASRFESMKKDIELHDLALRLRNSLKNLTAAYEGDNECGDVIFEQVNQFGELISKLGDGEYYGFSSWLNFKMHQVDFGWGKPSGARIPGLVGPGFCNFTYLKHIGDNKAVEAWVTLEEAQMAMLERDPGFLAFASPNPHNDKIKM